MVFGEDIWTGKWFWFYIVTGIANLIFQIGLFIRNITEPDASQNSSLPSDNATILMIILLSVLAVIAQIFLGITSLMGIDSPPNPTTPPPAFTSTMYPEPYDDDDGDDDDNDDNDKNDAKL
ncbi:hypothetical protein TKK_0006263 [Trichogramma kaykai]